MIYAQLNDSDICYAVTEVANELKGDKLVPVASYDLELLGMRWNGKSWEKSPAAVSWNITILSFLRRFTDEEAITIDLASIGATVEAATMRRYLNKVNAATHVDLLDPETISGVRALEYVGILAKGRAEEILTTPPEEKELAHG